tara:strand:- start:46 stop:345 length:300 start_codon:yes stop_codon:yes gene_type:complete
MLKNCKNLHKKTLKNLCKKLDIGYIILYYILNKTNEKGNKMTRRKGKRQKRIDAFLEDKERQQLLKDNVDFINEICNRVRDKKKAEKAERKRLAKLTKQ